MASKCDLVTQGYYLGNGWEKVPKVIRQRAEETALHQTALFYGQVVTSGK